MRVAGSTDEIYQNLVESAGSRFAQANQDGLRQHGPMAADRFALVAAGVFFLAGLLSGVWKYGAIARSEKAEAPVYVDVGHRAALLYAFACLLVERMVQASQLSATVELGATVIQIVFFGLALSTYFIHGFLDDTDNQLRRPHKLGNATLPPWVIRGFMGALILAEVGGFAVLLYGVVVAP